MVSGVAAPGHVGRSRSITPSSPRANFKFLKFPSILFHILARHEMRTLYI